jgi:hypothetical protein
VNSNLSPRHLQLRATLFRRWKTQGLQPGDKIESQNAIMKLCDFSLITIMKTLKDLEAEGVIRRQVGKGSFLVKTPWVEGHWRVGFFYNREIVGGGIFDNAFYTKMVIAIEKRIVSDGHEFVLGSFTHAGMPTNIWDALDAVIVTGITNKTDTMGVLQTTSQISLIDVFPDSLPLHSFRLDFGSPFFEMFRRFLGQSHNYLYLDSKIKSPEQSDRRQKFTEAHLKIDPSAKVYIVQVDQEAGGRDIEELKAVIETFEPDNVCGYIHPSWPELIEKWSVKTVVSYSFTLDSEEPGFVVSTTEWMEQVLPKVYDNLANRQLAPSRHVYEAKFIS